MIHPPRLWLLADYPECDWQGRRRRKLLARHLPSCKILFDSVATGPKVPATLMQYFITLEFTTSWHKEYYYSKLEIFMIQTQYSYKLYLFLVTSPKCYKSVLLETRNSRIIAWPELEENLYLFWEVRPPKRPLQLNSFAIGCSRTISNLREVGEFYAKTKGPGSQESRTLWLMRHYL